MPSGRSSTPNHLRIAGGEYRKNIPDIEEGRPDKPANLNDDASGIWDWLIESLETQGKLTSFDRESIASAAIVYGEMVASKAAMDASGRVAEDSHGNPVVHPNFRIWKELVTRWNDALRQFGLTPSTRNRVAAVAKKKANAFDLYKQAADAGSGEEPGSQVG